ncbi:DUF2716 domain-containing protein [Actinoallomurus bryophytorum]|uniref:Uncharacterized protein DUF2716 n=1 Tax=Actinoallomurus bryophytorum TaxID=1490222 RepID=A0A543C0V5_9ACTN|nr:DUF2716 domain-containing protein [Actinoallomurus bryophytorum]TQL90717.1 uncharacterized protein DUF2716 [Actinoallomurus bryophytorum]
MSGRAGVLLTAYDAQLRGRVPGYPPAGAVVERDGPLVRTHYGTHGTVDLDAGPVPADAGLIRRQQAVFAERGEPVEWRVHSHDQGAELGERLREAGFAAGWERAVLVAEIDGLPGPGALPDGRGVRELLRGEHDLHERIRRIAAATEPHRTSLTEMEADGDLGWNSEQILMLESGAGLLGAAWAQRVDGTEFISIGGMTGPHAEFVPALTDWARLLRRRSDVREFVAEADGALRHTLLRSGFYEITQVTTYHWSPPGPVAPDRPVKRLIFDSEHDALWDRFNARFAFEPGIETYPGITEPPASVTWHLAAIDRTDGPAAARLEAIIERGLRACARPGELLYWLDRNHVGARFDPQRVGGPDRPPWPGAAYPDGDYLIHLTDDLRLGTFGHPRENSLCVFGDELLPHVEEDLNALLGAPMRRGGRTRGDLQA